MSPSPQPFLAREVPALGTPLCPRSWSYPTWALVAALLPVLSGDVPSDGTQVTAGLLQAPHSPLPPLPSTGIECPRGARNLPGLVQEGEPFSEEATHFTKELVLQREVGAARRAVAQQGLAVASRPGRFGAPGKAVWTQLSKAFCGAGDGFSPR